MRNSPLSGRRSLLIGGLSLASLGVLAGLFKHHRDELAGVALPAPDTAELIATLLAFMAALFGHELTDADGADLAARVELLLSDAVHAANCAVLVRVLEEAARRSGSSAFELCSSYQQDAIINKIMDLNEKSKLSRIWSRWSMNERDTYRMRRSAIPQLAWLYRHSAVAWRTRGYSRWAGMAGDWRETLVPGPPYP